MDVYLASPNTQQQAEHCEEMNVLLSFAIFGKWMWQYQPSFRRVLIDSGAFSEMNSGKKIDIEAYKDWSQLWQPRAEAVAGLDDITGDWKRSLKNYEAIPWSFPTWHDTDPIELLDDLIPMAQERKTWIGLGLMPPRHGKEKILRNALERIPTDIHVHGWALRAYTHIGRFDSVDSTNWWRDAMALRKQVPWLHYGECLGLIVKRYQRENRVIHIPDEQSKLF
jgi:hypothetical protein